MIYIPLVPSIHPLSYILHLATTTKMSTIALIVAGLAALQGAEAQSQWCYSYGRRYRCDRGGLGYGARIGIGVGIAAGTSILHMLSFSH